MAPLLANRLDFLGIAEVVEATLEACDGVSAPASIADVEAIDIEARRRAAERLGGGGAGHAD